jgi:hypothetical protein
VAGYPPADITIDRIGDMLHYPEAASFRPPTPILRPWTCRARPARAKEHGPGPAATHRRTRPSRPPGRGRPTWHHPAGDRLVTGLPPRAWTRLPGAPIPSAG